MAGSGGDRQWVAKPDCSQSRLAPGATLLIAITGLALSAQSGDVCTP